MKSDEIVAQIAKLIGSADALAPAGAEKQSVRELWDRYVRVLPDERWVRSVKSMMVRPIAHFGDMDVSQLKPFHWSDFRDRDDVKAELSSTTRNLILRRMRALFNWALDDGRLAANPFQRVKPERARPKRETEFSEFDEARFLKTAPLKMAVFFTIAIDSGMRHDEIRLLRWDQIDMRAGTVALSWSQTKSKRSGTAYLTTRAIKALRMMPRVLGSPHVFANPATRKPYSYACFHKTFRAIIAELDIKAAPGDGRPHAHDARHSLASRLSRRGAPLPAIQGILRHAHLATTARYIHTRPDEIAAAHALLEQVRKEPRRGPQRSTMMASTAPISLGSKGAL